MKNRMSLTTENDFDRVGRFLKEYWIYLFPQQGGNVDVHFRFVERLTSKEVVSHHLEAWIASLADTTKHSFVIFVSISLLRGISDVCTAMTVGVERVIAGVAVEDFKQ